MSVESSKGNQDAYLEKELNSTWSTAEVDAMKPTLEHDLDRDSTSSTLVASSTLEEDKANSGRILVVGGEGNYLSLADGRKILDGCGGAAVACLGHGVKEVSDAIFAQSSTVSYVPWGFLDSQSRRDLNTWLSQSSGGHFTKAWITSSGSEAMEGSIKLAREYFVWTGETQRVNYIARDESYHGITLGVLSVGGHFNRRAPFQPLLTPNVYHIPACNPYRQRLPGEADEEFVSRKVEELEKAFIQAGPDSVVAFIAEPVVGAAAGCMPSVPGYFKAMKAVCDKYGALLILDEVMCGMGRTGTLHAWEQEGVIPDIQAVGKGLGGGFQPASAILASQKIVQVMEAKNVAFTHGHTYMDHPVVCATALKVQQIIKRDNLLENVKVQGRYLETLLRTKLQDHPHVGDIRGRGLFWGVELVEDKATKKPFDPKLQLSLRVQQTALSAPHNLAIYHGQGCAGQGRGDHIMIMPAYNVTSDVIEMIVDRFVAVLDDVFGKLEDGKGVATA
ncbi:PLP-dependent transferase [Annulohypoxylon maeteangense]|uniref:PLP-dependent transferase n=1 Tax=Annulohypoxylon maeteangense TaxID=1927788 RepID=UPI0020082EB7|nr:PLP-dependent transferase [Annulohypoxylon maeteangense]KAI0881894.1 PLP-dependent transferase [Annulohypoxylon maeteangense]